MLTCEIHYDQKNKKDENICGDSVKIKIDTDKTVVSISDGLGSGIKASISSTLTTSMATQMVFNGISINETFESILETLPVCKIRGLSYATLATCLIDHKNQKCTIYEYDFPTIFIYRNGNFIEFGKKIKYIQDKKIGEISFCIEQGDIILLMTDGITQAGMGCSKYPFGFGIENIKKYFLNLIENNIDLKEIAKYFVKKAILLDDGIKGDDATFCLINIRKTKVTTIMVGPPETKENDEIVTERLIKSDGKKIVCGGTTSQIVERVLNKKIELDISQISEISPPIGIMEGIDLITEGIITLTQVFRYYENQSDEIGVGAKRMIKIIEESDIINFLVGRALNPAHQNPLFAHDISLKFRLIQDIAKILQRNGKIVNIEYF